MSYEMIFKYEDPFTEIKKLDTQFVGLDPSVEDNQTDSFRKHHSDTISENSNKNSEFETRFDSVCKKSFEEIAYFDEEFEKDKQELFDLYKKEYYKTYMLLKQKPKTWIGDKAEIVRTRKYLLEQPNNPPCKHHY